MEDLEQLKEKKRKRNAMILSLSIHAALILLFVFLVAWREPNPPLPEYGIEINFGTDDAGSGDVQPETPVVESQEAEEPAPAEETDMEEVQEENLEETEELPEAVEEQVNEPVETQEPVVEDIDSPDVVEEEQEVPKEIKKEVEETVPVKETEESVTGGTPVSGEGEADKPAEVNQGDKTDETGDQGSEEGKIDARALYGNPGAGGGSSLEMAGWTWDEIPKPNDTSDEEGKIVFEITIDDQGYIVSIKTIETTVSAAVEKIYRGEVEELTFSKTDNNPPAPRSTGRITFIIKAR